MPRTTFYGHKIGQVTLQPNIGLEASARQSVVEILKLLLADEAVLSLKTLHEKGPDGVVFSALQPIYDAQYQQINAVSNEISERVQILGCDPPGISEEFADSARLGLNTAPGIVSILADHEAFIRFLREDAQKCSELYEDQGTYTLLINVLRTHEKMAWILRSNITSGQIDNEK